jgi:RNA polymerase sigma factor (sigma-70 family)
MKEKLPDEPRSILEEYIGEQRFRDTHRKSLEGLTQAELRTLEEEPITADAEGEIYFPEDLDDSEIPALEFDAPADASNPEQRLEKKEEMEQILQALARIPVNERVAFELFVVEGFPKKAVAKIANVSPHDVQRIAQKLRAAILGQLSVGSKPPDATKKTA